MVPPRGFEPLISTLKGWRPRPLDDEGERRRVYQRASSALDPRQPLMRVRTIAPAKHAAATSAAIPPRSECPKARASRPWTLERHVARAATAAIAAKTRPRTTDPETTSGI